MLATVGFFALAFLLAGYVLLDGYDLGIGTISPFVTRNDRERGALLEAIGPFWNGNEVWLIAAGAVLFGLFPIAYAVSFSGFYLPLIIVLWLLMFRGISIELRDTIDSPVWRTLWDALFMISSALLVLFFGVALGNLVRGVDLEHSGYFFGSFSVLLNPFSLVVGVFAVVALALHGLLYAAMRIEGALAERCTWLARRLWWATAALFVITTAFAFSIYHGADVHPVLSGFVTFAALAALIALRRAIGRARLAFLLSCAFLTLLMVAAAISLFPYLVPNQPRGTGGLTIYDAQPGSSYALATMLVIIVVAVVAMLAYRAAVADRVTQPVRVDDEGGYG